mgnify:CR=1 FL=1
MRFNQKTLFVNSAVILAIIFAIYLRLAPGNLEQTAKTQQPTVQTPEFVSSAVQRQVDLTQDTPWAAEKTPVLIYREEIGSTDGPTGRGFPTVKIWRKVGSEPHEELAVVGKVNEFPNEVIISPNKRSLLINLESKLQLLDLETKEVKDIFTPRKSTYLTPVFSPDGKELFIWDQFYAKEDKEYFVYRLNLETLVSTLITSGDNGSVFGPVVWRDDNKVVMYEPLGEFARSWYFDLSTNKIIQTPYSDMYGFVSNDGKSMSIVSDWVDDICNEFSGSAWSGYKIIDPVSGAIQGRLKQQGKPTSIAAFSPDKKQILYVTGENVTDQNQCSTESDSPTTHYISNYNGGNAKKIRYDLFMKLVNHWGYDTIGAAVKYNYQNNSSAIYLNETLVVSSDKELGIIAEYFK